MWRSTSLGGKWLAALLLLVVVTSYWWVWSLALALLLAVWFRQWYPGLLPAVWFDLLFGSPLKLPFYPRVVPITFLLALFLILVEELKRHIRLT